MNKEETIRLEKSRHWRENNLLSFLFLNLILPLFLLTLVSFLVPQIYTIVPVYESETCWEYFTERSILNKSDDNEEIPCGLKITNSIVFIILNWLEVFGFALLFWLVRNIKNELNVKSEVQSILIFWGIFSLIYFLLNLWLNRLVAMNSTDYIPVGKWFIFVAIQLRNISTLCATTMFSIYTLYRNPEKAYPKTYDGKLEALDFELVLTSSLPFEYFYDFVS